MNHSAQNSDETIVTLTNEPFSTKQWWDHCNTNKWTIQHTHSHETIVTLPNEWRKWVSWLSLTGLTSASICFSSCPSSMTIMLALPPLSSRSLRQCPRVWSGKEWEVEQVVTVLSQERSERWNRWSRCSVKGNSKHGWYTLSTLYYLAIETHVWLNATMCIIRSESCSLLPTSLAIETHVWLNAIMCIIRSESCSLLPTSPSLKMQRSTFFPPNWRRVPIIQVISLPSKSEHMQQTTRFWDSLKHS